MPNWSPHDDQLIGSNCDLLKTIVAQGDNEYGDLYR